MLEVYKQFWKSYIDFSGRTTRKEWWIVTFFSVILTVTWLTPTFLAFIFSSNDGGVFDFPVYGIIALILGVFYELANLIPSYSMYVRRLRDAGFHWGLIFTLFVPYVGSLAVFVLMQFPTKKAFEDTPLSSVEG